MSEDEYDFDEDRDGVICPRCMGDGSVNCYCGGDLCVCWNYGERDCPTCHGEGEVSEERQAKYFGTLPAAPDTSRTGEQVERLCPCGKPALPTASICSDCADACLASGEGEAPVAWRYRWVEGRRTGKWFYQGHMPDRLGDEGEVEPLYTRPTPATLATCQACGGPIEGWICQSCDREFREDDTGNLVFDEDTPATPEGLGSDAAKIVRRWANWIINESADMDVEDRAAGKRKVRAERDLILSALQPQAQPAALSPETDR